MAQPPGIIGRAAAAGCDLAWTHRELFLVRGKEPANVTCAANIFANEAGTSVAFDGKYVWAWQNPADQPVVAGQETALRQPRRSWCSTRKAASSDFSPPSTACRPWSCGR